MPLTMNPGKIRQTIQLLERRISERFPESSLAQIAAELVNLSGEAVERSQWIARPIYSVRILVTLLVAALLAVAWYVLSHFSLSAEGGRWFDLMQGIDAFINDLVFLGAAIIFLVSLEVRIKRKRVLGSMRVLRSMAHLIDMHQLTKDPGRALQPGNLTASSPARAMNIDQLSRYLDYCSEMLAIISKIAAIYIDRFDDSGAVEAVDQIEQLTSGIQRKIWQKIGILMARAPGA